MPGLGFLYPLVEVVRVITQAIVSAERSRMVSTREAGALSCVKVSFGLPNMSSKYITEWFLAYLHSIRKSQNLREKVGQYART